MCPHLKTCLVSCRQDADCPENYVCACEGPNCSHGVMVDPFEHVTGNVCQRVNFASHAGSKPCDH